LATEVEFSRVSPDGDLAITDARFVSPSMIMLRIDQLDDQLEAAVNHIMDLIDNFISNGSGWTIGRIKCSTIQCAAYYQIGGSSYLSLPKWLEAKKALINIKNKDDMCFAYCVLAHIHPKHTPNRAYQYRCHLPELDLSGLKWPMPINQIHIFEKNNVNIAINVTYFDRDRDKKTIVPLYASKHRGRQHVVNLLLIEGKNKPEKRALQNGGNNYLDDAAQEDEDDDEDDDDDDDGDGSDDSDDDEDILGVRHAPASNRTHYVLISGLSRLLAHRSANNHACHVCPYCLHRFWQQNALDRHIVDCGQNAPCRITFPMKTIPAKKPANGANIQELPNLNANAEAREIEKQIENPDFILKFKNYIYSHRVPCVIYADFESFIVRNANVEATDDLHVPSGYCCLTVFDHVFARQNKAHVYSGENVMESFFDYLNHEQNIINNILAVNVPMNELTAEQQDSYELATKCGCCEEEFTTSNYKCRHHCHVSGTFVGPMCTRCNLQLKFRQGAHCAEDAGRKFFIPVVFHGLRNYDSHIIIKHLRVSFTHDLRKRVTCIANNQERFISFSIGSLRFLDSYQFLACSLETLASNLANDDLKLFRNTRRHFPDEEQFKLLTRKGIYPYEYVDSAEKFAEAQLPPKEAFYSSLYDSGANDEEYAHAQSVWRAFDIKNMQEYHDLYLLTDVLLLSDIFENFRDLTVKYYQLDSLHYHTLPGLSMDACLRKTGVRLELLTKIDELLFIERGIRGGVSYICNRYAHSNIPHSRDYSPDADTSFISYIDCNNLYGLAQTQPLPISDFSFLNETEMKAIDIMNVEDDADFGYILEVDLDYPAALHDYHSDYPLCPEHLLVTADMLSERQRELLKKFDLKAPGGPNDTKKLIPNLLPKRRYVLHYRCLKFYVQEGLKLVAVHRIMRFRQKDWLKPYVDFNTVRRQQSKNAFEKSFFKLMINALFGKLMEQLRQRVDCRIVTNEEQAKRLTAKPTFVSFKIVNDDITIVKMRKTTIYWNKPIYCGLAVLDLSKLWMYQFYYGHIKRMYAERVKLLFTDTDSFCLSIKTNDIYEDMRKNAEWYDLSDYPRDHPSYSPRNAKVLGKFKDEMMSVKLSEFVGLRSKMYSMLAEDGGQKVTAKGISRSYVEAKIKHADYRACLFDEERTVASYRSIRSVNQQLMTRNIVKSCLSPYDTKRYFQEGTTDTLPYGHYRISERNNINE
jgi:hypothetical protein